MTKPIANVNERIVMMCAMRYALGRRSYAPGAVIEYIISREDILDKSDREVIERDIKEYLADNPDMAYKEKWLNLISIIKTK
jgi:hypothetical protein